LSELEAAAKNLGRIVESFEDAPAHVGLDVRKFRGLLDWPAEGVVSAKFGTVVHPRFKTQVPHPGLDIEAPDGQPFRTIFDGRVAYASPLNGYGLTVVVDHGNGVVSIYAHAAVLLVEVGENVVRDQELGRVGDSGSLRGPYLYFEMREAGKPVDPSSWLRRR
jgi:murein DD-endopeptidase MepM/ murein hydrolase activator NlpD